LTYLTYDYLRKYIRFLHVKSFFFFANLCLLKCCCECSLKSSNWISPGSCKQFIYKRTLETIFRLVTNLSLSCERTHVHNTFSTVHKYLWVCWAQVQHKIWVSKLKNNTMHGTRERHRPDKSKTKLVFINILDETIY
jgi:hypothetical protein